MKRRPPSDDPQAIADAIISTKWTVAIIRTLLEGPARFSRIRAANPAISANILTSRLRYLEEQDVIRRSIMPPRVVSAYEIFSYVHDDAEGGPSESSMRKALNTALAELNEKLLGSPLRIMRKARPRGWTIELRALQRAEAA
ncbi:helix-turn-helix transcriptional regulator [Sphingobium sp. JS3065]|nr:helix-turn-helix transcriptional regulator [Sphingobium sp. JS3065]